MKVLVTGAAGFIGFHLVQRLLGRGDEVVGLDNLNAYYPVVLKEARLAQIDSERFRFVRMDLADREALPALFAAERFDAVVNLAAQAGVRYSVENPWAYVDSNVVGFLNILECCRHYPVRHLVYASSSSVYGGNEKTPFSEEDRVDNPVSLYAATKKADELMAGCYCHLYGLKATGLRFFTVYGPWGRPDMSPMLFASAILAGKPIKVFNHGDMLRDFTYIDDIVEGVVRVLDRVPDRHEVFNIGCSSPVKLMDFISEMERALGREADKVMLPMQPGDVYQTYADTGKLERELGYKPSVKLREGIGRFVDWYLSDLNPLR
jgi:UDP-glucuronate 4-epimerase